MHDYQSGIVTLVRLVKEENAFFSMRVTDLSSILLGMVTAPPEPAYPVIVMLPAISTYIKSSYCSAVADTAKEQTTNTTSDNLLQKDFFHPPPPLAPNCIENYISKNSQARG